MKYPSTLVPQFLTKIFSGKNIWQRKVGNKLTFVQEKIRGKVLQDAALIVMDEATMGEGLLYQCFDDLLKDIMGHEIPALSNVPFGGKLMVLSGDFRQPGKCHQTPRTSSVPGCQAGTKQKTDNHSHIQLSVFLDPKK